METPQKHEKLVTLANKLREHETYDQSDIQNCVIGIGLKLAKVPVSFDKTRHSQLRILFAEKYGIKVSAVIFLYTGKFHAIDDKLERNYLDVESVGLAAAERAVKAVESLYKDIEKWMN